MASRIGGRLIHRIDLYLGKYGSLEQFNTKILGANENNYVRDMLESSLWNVFNLDLMVSGIDSCKET